MKFSVRQFLVFIVVLGLIFGFIASQWKLRHADAEIAKLRELAGMLNNVSGDGYLLQVCGGQDRNQDTFNGCLLLRVIEYQKYKLRLTHYDSQTKDAVSREVDINEPILALTCGPWKNGQYFEVAPTVPVNPRTEHLTYHTIMKDHHCYLLSHGGGNAVSDLPIGGFTFYPASQKESPTFADLMHCTEEHLRKICNEYQMQAVYFTILPRN
jgi:hypothetical protein